MSVPLNAMLDRFTGCACHHCLSFMKGMHVLPYEPRLILKLICSERTFLISDESSTAALAAASVAF